MEGSVGICVRAHTHFSHNITANTIMTMKCIRRVQGKMFWWNKKHGFLQSNTSIYTLKTFIDCHQLPPPTLFNNFVFKVFTENQDFFRWGKKTPQKTSCLFEAVAYAPPWIARNGILPLPKTLPLKITPPESTL